jgi:hypothetical protein
MKTEGYSIENLKALVEKIIWRWEKGPQLKAPYSQSIEPDHLQSCLFMRTYLEVSRSGGRYFVCTRVKNPYTAF